jgi:hypothetical protein
MPTVDIKTEDAALPVQPSSAPDDQGPQGELDPFCVSWTLVTESSHAPWVCTLLPLVRGCNRSEVTLSGRQGHASCINGAYLQLEQQHDERPVRLLHAAVPREGTGMAGLLGKHIFYLSRPDMHPSLRQVYRSTHSIPPGFAEASGKHLFLSYHAENDAWAAATEPGRWVYTDGRRA